MLLSSVASRFFARTTAFSKRLLPTAAPFVFVEQAHSSLFERHISTSTVALSATQHPSQSQSGEMRILSDDDVRRCVSVEAAIEVNQQAFLALHQERANVPARHMLPVPQHEGFTLFKPAHISAGNKGEDASNEFATGGLGLKVVSIRPRNADIGRPTVPATIMTFNEETGEAAAVVSATFLTALRTAAGSAVATRVQLQASPVERPQSIDTLCIIGAGLQGEQHIRTISSVVPGRLV